MRPEMPATEPSSWLLLIHQIPPQPAYLRVKIGRRLAKVGAVALKNSVYVLPDTAEGHEHFQWIAREIEEDGGEASVSAARLLGGLTDEAMRNLFRQARDADYTALAGAAHEAAEALAEGRDEGPARRELSRLQRRLDEIAALDWFRAPARAEAETALMALRGHIEGERQMDRTSQRSGATRAADYQGRTWVTREGVKVDRIASAWLIRQFIDPAARFRFVPPQGYRPAEGEVRFDMFEAEFTHEGDACTFEVLLRHLGPDDPALAAIAELVHDIDLHDGKFGRPEAAGLERLLNGIALTQADDATRLERGAALLDDLYASLGGTAARAD